MTDSPQAAPTRQLLLRRAAFFTVFALVVAGIIGVTLYLIYRSSFLPRHDAAAVAPNVTVKALVSFPDDRTFPDGLALAPGGTLYLTLFGTGAIDKIDSTGKLTPFITDKSRIVSPGAILVAPDNMIYVLDYTLSEQAVGTLKKITPDGAVSTWGSFGTDQVTLFGALALDAAENLYVTTGDRQVWRFSPDGKGVVWWTAAPVDNAAPQTTGIAYDAGHNAMIIG
ncbi:MAG TPA: hypothetical protein VMT34_17400, partial [Aggregatilineales bacterium]|nr:hypothetical protein [Aggregatilineales bacterium]